jgi:hypothetical protein
VTTAPFGPSAPCEAFDIEIDGRVVSVTVTGKDALDVLPWLSVALQFTVVSPTGNTLPDGGVQLAAAPPDGATQSAGGGDSRFPHDEQLEGLLSTWSTASGAV